MSKDRDIVIQTRDLTKRYGEFVALDRLTMDVSRGKILGFIGPNGAGKTTTIKILVGLAKPTSGTATIAGRDCSTQSREIKRLVGYMPDTFGSYDNMRVREYLDFFGAAFKVPRRQRQRRIDETLDITGSTYMKDRYVQSLSHGMKQRVAVARTLLHDPEVLILDEPANGLDPNARIEMRDLLLQLAAMGKTLIVTSHILPELSQICSVVAIVTGGVLRAFGTLEEIMRTVSAQRTFEIEVLNADEVDEVASLVGRMLGENTQVTTSHHESLVRVVTERSDQTIAQALSGLVQRGHAVVQLREVMLDLEDAFLSVTKSGKAAAGGTRGNGGNGGDDVDALLNSLPSV